MGRYMVIVLALILGGVRAAGESGVVLSGAGATFPQPLYNHWIEVYGAQTGGRLTYEGIGSGGGIRKLLAREVDFGGTDAFLNDEELTAAGTDILHIPTCIGAVAVTYNLPGINQLRLTQEILAGIFLGDIQRWSDPRIAAVNPGLALPDLPVTLIHRADSSGTTFVFTSYLSRVSDTWRQRIGAGKEVRWPHGLGLDGNPRVADYMTRVPGAIGYVEMTYAVREELTAAALRNRRGRFVRPDLAGARAAAEVSLPADTRTLIVDTDAEAGYPLSAFTWLIVYREQGYDNRSRERAEALADFLWWAVHKGQDENERILYAKLPAAAVSRAEEIIRSMTYNGEAVR